MDESIKICHYNGNDDVIVGYTAGELLVSLNHDDDGRWGMERHLGTIRELAERYNLMISEDYVDWPETGVV